MAIKNSLADTLAKELGFKDAKALRDHLKLKHGPDFAGNVKSRLEEGGGFGESFGGAAKDKINDVKEAFSKKGLKKLGKKAYGEVFGGDDIFSSYMRGRLNKKERAEKEASSPSNEGESGGGLSEDATSVLSIIAKNSMSLPGMARDMNVLRQNIVKLVKLKGGKTSRFGGKADAFFKNSKEREASLESEIVSKKKVPGKVPGKVPEKGPASPTPQAGGGGISDIFTTIKDGIIQGAKKLFNPKNLLKILGKLALPLLIISTLFAGIKAGFEKYQETGSFTEAIVAGLGGMLSFLTFGLLGEDTLKQVFDSLSGVFKPVLDTVSGIFDSIKGFFKNIFGDTVDVKEVESGSPKDVTPKLPGGGKIGGPGGEGEAKLGGPGGVADIAGAEITSKLTKMGMPEGAIPKGIFGDMGSVIDAGNSGGLGAMIGAAGELNKNLTSKVSGNIGVDLPMPGSPSPVASAPAAYGGGSGAAPLPVSQDKPAPDLAPAGSAGEPTPAAPPPAPPSPTAAAGEDKFAAKAESNKLGALQFLKRTLGILPDKDGYIDMRNGENKLSEEEVRQRISTAGKDPDKVLGLLKSAEGKGTLDISSGNLNQITGGAIGGGGGGGGSSSLTGEPAVSGASLSSASTDVAESQRMESAADAGSVVNAPTNNSSSGSSGQPNKQTASAYDTDFAQRLATT